MFRRLLNPANTFLRAANGQRGPAVRGGQVAGKPQATPRVSTEYKKMKDDFMFQAFEQEIVSAEQKVVQKFKKEGKTSDRDVPALREAVNEQIKKIATQYKYVVGQFRDDMMQQKEKMEKKRTQDMLGLKSTQSRGGRMAGAAAATSAFPDFSDPSGAFELVSDNFVKLLNATENHGMDGMKEFVARGSIGGMKLDKFSTEVPVIKSARELPDVFADQEGYGYGDEAPGYEEEHEKSDNMDLGDLEWM